MNKALKILFFLLLFASFFLASWRVLNKDIEFTSEIARDFFLLNEVYQKKFVLIGPSSTTGLFHGPLWAYLNFPAFFVGNGNPIVVGWFWVFLSILFVFTNFFIAKKLFDTKTGYLFALMTAIYMIFHAKNFYNPHGAMLLLPSFFFFFIRYLQSRNIKFLIIHLLIAGAIIQFQMAIGIPFFILSFLYLLYTSLKSSHKIHLLSYLLIFITLSNFFIFDLRHDFLLSKLTLRFLTSAGRDNPDILSMFWQRFQLMTGGIEFLRRDPGSLNLLIFAVSSIFFFLQLKNNKFKNIYITFLYFYIGYFLLSNLNSGGLLYFYLFPIFPLVFLIFSSFITSSLSKVFMILFTTILLLNLQNALNDTFYDRQNIIGKSENSWIFLNTVASEIFKDKEKEFGYFVYSPDVVAYRGKYAMFYEQKKQKKRTYYFKKKPITYLIIAPPPIDNPYMKDEWWRINQIKIKGNSIKTIRYSNGYKIEKYSLSEDEIKIPFDPAIDPGIVFR